MSTIHLSDAQGDRRELLIPLEAGLWLLAAMLVWRTEGKKQVLFITDHLPMGIIS